MARLGHRNLLNPVDVRRRGSRKKLEFEHGIQTLSAQGIQPATILALDDTDAQLYFVSRVRRKPDFEVRETQSGFPDDKVNQLTVWQQLSLQTLGEAPPIPQ